MPTLGTESLNRTNGAFAARGLRLKITKGSASHANFTCWILAGSGEAAGHQHIHLPKMRPWDVRTAEMSRSIPHKRSLLRRHGKLEVTALASEKVVTVGSVNLDK
jgi:hypothetical protein